MSENGKIMQQGLIKSATSCGNGRGSDGASGGASAAEIRASSGMRIGLDPTSCKPANLLATASDQINPAQPSATQPSAHPTCGHSSGTRGRRMEPRCGASPVTISCGSEFSSIGKFMLQFA